MQRIEERTELSYTDHGIASLMSLVQALNEQNLPARFKLDLVREGLHRLNNDPCPDLLTLIPEFSYTPPAESFHGSGTEIAETTPVPYINNAGYIEVPAPQFPNYLTLFGTTEPQVTEEKQVEKKLVSRPLHLKKDQPQNKYQAAFSLLSKEEIEKADHIATEKTEHRHRRQPHRGVKRPK